MYHNGAIFSEAIAHDLRIVVHIMSRPVLVTGAAGFVGAHVVRALLRRGLDVVALVRDTEACPRLRDVRERVCLAAADLEVPERVARVLDALGPAAIVHPAWYVHPGDYLSSPRNVPALLAAASLFEQAAARGARVVAVGSCLEYAPTARPMREDDPTLPASLYAACKLAAGVVGRALAATRGLRFTWARLFHVHGPGEAPERLLPAVARALRAGQPFELSPGDQVRDHLHVEDAAEALAHLACSDATGVVNVCSGRPLSLRELLTTLGEELGRTELLRFGARPPVAPDARFLCGDPARLRGLGFTPAHTDLRADLRELVGAC